MTHLSAYGLTIGVQFHFEASFAAYISVFCGGPT